MTAGRSWALAAATLLWLGAAASAQAPVPAQPGAAAEPAPVSKGGVAATTRLPAPSGVRRPRSFRECAREAQARRLRGMERRRFVGRCQAGSGRPLFRRRGPPPSVAPAPR